MASSRPPSSVSPRPIAVFDIDGTWYRWQLAFVWIEVAVEQGVLPKIVLTKAKNVLEAYQDRKAPWSKFVEMQVSAYQDEARMRDIRLSDAREVAQLTMRRYGGKVHVFTKSLHEAAKECSYATAAISGSLEEIVAVFCEENGVAYHRATEHPHQDGLYTGGQPVQWALKKKEALEDIAREYNLDLTRSIAIGDSEADVPMLEMVTWPLCMNPNRRLDQVARERGWSIVIERKDNVMFFRPDTHGSLHEVGFDQILPTDVANVLAEKLFQRVL